MQAHAPMTAPLSGIVDLARHPLADASFRERCRATLDRDGALTLSGFLTAGAVESVRAEGEARRGLAFYCSDDHNVFLTPSDPAFTPGHPRNRTVSSSKGCITDDQVPLDSALRVLYDDPGFRDFLCAVLGETELHEYADPLSSINVHYASESQELGWHFDNSSFATTLLIQAPEEGGVFEYVRGLRDSAGGEMDFEGIREVLDGERPPAVLALAPGTLSLFRGRDSMHRVTPVRGERTRMLVVLAYNAEPGIALSESARMTFYGRLG